VIEVINSGVLGYTPYNELEYYRADGHRFEPDLVVVAFCMNDVADPELHWSATPREVPPVPSEAIPNLEYHRRHVTALLPPSLPFVGRRSFLLRRVHALTDPRRTPEWRAGRFTSVGGKTWPTYVTSEDNLSIAVLVDDESAEWRWLRRTYAKLRALVDDDGGTLAIAVVPLAYQLEDGYPFRPQDNFARLSRDEGIPVIPLVDALRAHRAEGVFPPILEAGSDIWHPTVRGHEVIASELDRALTDARLVPAPAAREPAQVRRGAGPPS
jgi:hypothetical protein